MVDNVENNNSPTLRKNAAATHSGVEEQPGLLPLSYLGHVDLRNQYENRDTPLTLP